MAAHTQQQIRFEKCMDICARGARSTIQSAINASLLINAAALVAVLLVMSKADNPTSVLVSGVGKSYSKVSHFSFYHIAITNFVIGILTSIISQCLVFNIYYNLSKLMVKMLGASGKMLEATQKKAVTALRKFPFILLAFSYLFFLFGGIIFLLIVVMNLS